MEKKKRKEATVDGHLECGSVLDKRFFVLSVSFWIFKEIIRRNTSPCERDTIFTYSKVGRRQKLMRSQVKSEDDEADLGYKEEKKKKAKRGRTTDKRRNERKRPTTSFRSDWRQENESFGQCGDHRKSESQVRQ